MLLHLKPYSYVNGFDTIIGAQDDANDWKAILDPVNKEYSWLLVESENEQLPEMKNAQLCICLLYTSRSISPPRIRTPSTFLSRIIWK